MNHGDTEPVEKRHDGEDERIRVLSDEPHNNVERQDNRPETKREPDDRHIQSADGTEVDEGKCCGGDDHRENDEARLNVSQFGRHFQPKQELFGYGRVGRVTGCC